MSIEAMKQALEALEYVLKPTADFDEAVCQKLHDTAITDLREALAEQQAAEPVAWMWKDGIITSDPDRADGTWTPLYTSPQPSKPWVGLTRDERMSIINRLIGQDWVYALDAIEAKLKEKNT